MGGDAARALGYVAVSARQKAEEFDDKHKIVDRSKKVANDAWQKAKTYDQSHNVLDTVLETIVYGWGAFVGFVKEHRLLEKGVDGVGPATSSWPSECPLLLPAMMKLQTK